jgi:hypothetical protein
MTKPSRSLSNGRDALFGFSLKFVDNARKLENPAIDNGLMLDSEPPATITSASPYSINLEASPIAFAPL